MNDRLDEFISKRESTQMSKHDELVLCRNRRDMEAAEANVRARETYVHIIVLVCLGRACC